MPDKTRLRKYKKDKQGNPIVFDVVSIKTGEIVASLLSPIKARNHVRDIDPGDEEHYAVRIRPLLLPLEDRENIALREYEELLRSLGTGLFVRCVETNSGTTFELWRTLDARKPIVLLVYPDGRFETLLPLGSSSDIALLRSLTASALETSI